MEPDTSGALEARVRELTARVYRLERTLQAHGIAPVNEAPPIPVQPHAPPYVQPYAQTTVGPEAIPAPMPAQEPPQGFPAPESVSHFAFHDAIQQQPAPDRDERTLESRIGSQWFNRIGILAMLIGMAWFLKLAIDNHWIGPLGRVLIGLIAGAAFIAWSERFQRKGYAAFGYSLKAVGSGTLYLSLWAAFSLYQLIPAGVAFAAMILVTGFNGFLAWVQDAELLALYAIAGGLTTPLLLSTGGNHEVTLFTYLLMLDVAVLTLVILRPWSRLLFAAFSGTTVFILGWWSEFYSSEQMGRTAFFLTCFFLIFSLAPRLVRVELKDGLPNSPWDNLALVVLPIVNAALGFLAYYLLFDPLSHEWAGAFVAVALAAFYLLLIQLPHRGLLRASTALVSSLHLTVAIVFLTIAIPLKAHGRWLTVGWLVEGAALLWVAGARKSPLLRALAFLCLLLGLGALLTVSTEVSSTPIFNTRFGTYLIAIAAFAFAAWQEQREASQDPAASAHSPAVDHRTATAAAILLVNALTLLALGLEIHAFWWNPHANREWRLLQDREMYAQFSYSALFMLYGAILLALGFSRRSAFVRWQALVLLALAIGKVFLLDVGQLSQGYRILSFLGLGALLLAISFVYQRDWLHLRDSQNEHPEKPAS